MGNPVEEWKSAKHGFDVWPDVLRYASERTPMGQIDSADLERMKWHGVFYRKRDESGTYMLRIRVPGCELTAEQARETAFIAYEYGHGIVDVTTRANLQVQGLAIETVPRAIERLAAVGLSAKQTGHDNIRNVFGHPFSGLDPDELIDTRELCRAITALFLDSRVYSDLPRKMNVAVNGREEHGLHYWSQDISYLATHDADGDVAFQVLIGGTQGQNPMLGRHLPVLVAPEQVVDVTRALLDLFREQGSREKRNEARFRFLVERIGVGGVLEYLDSHLPFRLAPCITEPLPPAGYDELVGWFRQKQPKRWTMGLCVPLGRLSWEQLEGLAVLSRKWGDGTLRTTHEQGIAVANIPTGFKDGAATDAAAHGLSLHADPLALNTVACTGKQFCNIAVTETKGHMFQLIERLRQRALMLHGIRIHMSGCPSSCAQHFTADIGLKGVRVKRLMGTREGFDVYLGGGVAGQVHLGIPYKLGVDADQLPQLIEEVVSDYYLKHRPGETFSAYWRERLRNAEAAKLGDADYVAPIWHCEGCRYEHRGEDPPVFCPKCAGLRRYFARLEDGASQSEPTREPDAAPAPCADGFIFAANADQLADRAGMTVQVGGKDLALFRVGEKVFAMDSACPHEGAPLGEGEVDDQGVVACPWHGWTFNACTGCSIEPAGSDVRRYEVKLEDGGIYVRVEENAERGTRSAELKKAPRSALRAPSSASLRVLDVIQETPDVKTFRLGNSAGALPPHRPGQFVKVCVPVDGREVWRSFTISSSPTQPGILDLTIKRNPPGQVSNYLHDTVSAGDSITVKGPQGAFYFDPEIHREPLVLISAGSGVTPMMSILRFLSDIGDTRPCTFLYGARSPADVIFAEDCTRLAQSLPNIRFHVSLTQPPAEYEGLIGRIEGDLVRRFVEDLGGSRFFLCGPGAFMDALCDSLLADGVPADRIHTEQFHSTPRKVPDAVVS